MTILDRLSLNQITTKHWTVSQAVEGCVRHGIRSIGLWRDKVAELGLAQTAKTVRDAGVAVSSLCRGGFFPASTPSERAARIDDSRRAIEEAATLGTSVLVLVCGPPAGKDLRESRAMVADGIEALLPDAAAHGVRLAIEPLHPMMIGQRSVICTLGEANALAERFPKEHVGVIVDVYHVWWDSELFTQIARAGSRILGFHVSDWVEPITDVVYGRGMMGDGLIDLRGIARAMADAGYQGPIEVEILNPVIWNRPGDEVLAEMKDRALVTLSVAPEALSP